MKITVKAIKRGFLETHSSGRKCDLGYFYYWAKEIDVPKKVCGQFTPFGEKMKYVNNGGHHYLCLSHSDDEIAEAVKTRQKCDAAIRINHVA